MPALARKARRGGGLILAASTLALAGCGLAVGPAPSAVSLLVSREFGSHVVHRVTGLRAKSGESVLDLLQGAAGASGPPAPSGERSLFVNGVLTSTAPALTALHPGDHVWSDQEGAHASPSPAVVGSFPEPFLNGIAGDRLPVRVECAPSSSAACATVTALLRSYGVLAAVAAIGSGAAPETLRVMVGEWIYIESDPEAQTIGQGPSASGVYAHIPPNGSTLTLLAPDGRERQTLHAGAGLIAATASRREAPLWVVTGTDAAGVELAARSLTPATLEDHFAVALEPGAVIPLPLSVRLGS